MKELLETVKEMMQEVEADDEFFDLMAKMTKKMHTALMNQGFSNDNAVKITASLMSNGPIKASK